MDSYILTVEKAICSLIADIVTTDNGRPFDLSQVVFRGRQRFGHGEPVPMVSVVQAPNIDIENNNAGKGRQRFSDKTFLIQGWVADDPQNPTDPAHELMAEVKRALSYTLDMDDPNFMFRSYNPKGNDLISNINISTGLVRPPESGISDKAYFWLPLIVTLIEDLSDPYSTP